MPSKRPLHKFIGDGILIITPSTQSSDGVATTDNLAGVPIAGVDGVLFVLSYGATDANAVFTIQIQYASNGTASDAATSNAGMTCTDALYTTTIHATASQIHFLDFDVAAKGLPDRAGKLYATVAAAETGASNFSLMGIPYGGTRLYPATNANTVIVANDDD